MATFEEQVEGITGLTISSSDTTPTQAELTEFLKDGVLEVTNMTLRDTPELFEQFQRETSTSDSQGVSVGGARVLSVLREGNADGSSDGTAVWYNCTKVPAYLQSRVVDPDSLHFASIYNPVYTIDNDKSINVYPVPSSNNGFKIYYINEEPKDITNDASLTYAHSNIKYFPNDKVYLVVLYASIKSLEAKMASYTIDEEDAELVSSISVNIQVLRDQFASAFKATETRYLAAKAGSTGGEG